MPVNIQRLIKLNQTEWLLFIQAYYLSIINSFFVVLFTQRFIFKTLGVKGEESVFEPIEGRLDEILYVEKAVRRAVRYLPWKTKCLARAITAKRILQRKKIPSTIYLGIAKDGTNKLTAHAWLRCGNRIVTGKEEMLKFTPILFFT